jgi:nucleoside 2-deoxyribosyltransferase
MVRRIYLAGMFDAQKRLRDVRENLEMMAEYLVIGTWLDEEGTATPDVATAAQYAKRDVAEVLLADTFILDTLDVNPRGGREVEWGLALMSGKTLWLVGPRRNVFHHLAHKQWDSWQEFFSKGD